MVQSIIPQLTGPFPQEGNHLPTGLYYLFSFHSGGFKTHPPLDFLHQVVKVRFYHIIVFRGT